MEDFRDAKSADIVFEVWNVFCSIATPNILYLLGRD